MGGVELGVVLYALLLIRSAGWCPWKRVANVDLVAVRVAIFELAARGILEA
jgi:hypothetical protein